MLRGLVAAARTRLSCMTQRVHRPRQHDRSCIKVLTASQRQTSTTSVPLKKTPLFEYHVEAGGKMVPFANYSMPIQYRDLSVSESHTWTREKASIFDVGHMVQHHLFGSGATELLSKVTPTSLKTLKPFHSVLSCLLHPTSGGIIDDMVITRLGQDSYYVVTNAACRDKDIAFMRSQIDEAGIMDVGWKRLDGWGLIALQGPLSSEILNEALASSADFDISKLFFGQCTEARIQLRASAVSDTVLISRAGYTGEDGFEISIPPNQTMEITQRLFQVGGQDRVRWAGLGARDSLRLEAGMCLYGHDLNETTTPVEAGLSWIIGKDRREDADFNGARAILAQLSPKGPGGTGIERRRVGLIVQGAPAREGAVIVGGGDEIIGRITSGSPSPSLRKNIAMGYIKSGWHKSGTEVGVLVRGKRRAGVVTKMPFLPAKYWKEGARAAPT